MVGLDPDLHRYELDLIERTERVCQNCRGLEFCNLSLGPRRIVARYDEESSVLYAVVRYHSCPHELLSVLEAQLGKRFASRTFGTFKPHPGGAEAYQAARDFAKGYEPGTSGTGLMFAGPTRAGKTHLAAAVLREIVFKGERDFRWVSLPAHGGRLYELRKHHLLVLDDLTELALKGYRDEGRRDLFGLLNYRYEAELPTIITTRMSRPEMNTVFGEEITSRLEEMCQLLPMRLRLGGKEAAS